MKGLRNSVSSYSSSVCVYAQPNCNCNCKSNPINPDVDPQHHRTGSAARVLPRFCGICGGPWRPHRRGRCFIFFSETKIFYFYYSAFHANKIILRRVRRWTVHDYYWRTAAHSLASHPQSTRRTQDSSRVQTTATGLLLFVDLRRLW